MIQINFATWNKIEQKDKEFQSVSFTVSFCLQLQGLMQIKFLTVGHWQKIFVSCIVQSLILYRS